MKFDLTFNLGNVISLVGFLVTIYQLHKSNTKRLDQIEAQVTIMYNWFCTNIVNKPSPTPYRRNGS